MRVASLLQVQQICLTWLGGIWIDDLIEIVCCVCQERKHKLAKQHQLTGLSIQLYSKNVKTHHCAGCVACHTLGEVVPSILEVSLLSFLWRSEVVESIAACSSQGWVSGLLVVGWKHTKHCWNLGMKMRVKTNSGPRHCIVTKLAHIFFLLTFRLRKSPSTVVFLEDDRANIELVLEPDVCLKQNKTVEVSRRCLHNYSDS